MPPSSLAPAQPCFGVALLAAGASIRMGRPKMLLPWAGTTVLGHHIQTWSRLPIQQISVVCDPNSLPILDELDRLGLDPSNRIPNPNATDGMFSSIQSAARWTGWQPQLTHFALALGDQPQIAPDSLALLLEASTLRPFSICQPSRHQRPRHPVILPRTAWTHLASSSLPNLKSFLNNHQNHILLVPIDDPGLDVDLDTPEDYSCAATNFAAVRQAPSP